MRTKLAQWGNSLAVRIPADAARSLNLQPGMEVECAVTADGRLELIPGDGEARARWLENHFARVNRRLADAPETTPTSVLLGEDARY
jgi:antitoxin MazE